jgi:sarcosine oxidase subunit alpha
VPRLSDPRFAPDCTIAVDGRRIPARTGEPITSALLAAGHPLLSRSAKYHRPRGPFCLAGSCGTCLVRVDGEPDVRACETPCRQGLRVETQNAVPGARRDLLGAIDWLAPRGLDHHHLATWSRLANRVAVAAARRLAGLGRLPGAPPAPHPPAVEEAVDALVVGAGPAGLGAAEALARAGRRVLLAERSPRPGGRLRARLDLPGDPPPSWAEDVAAAVRGAGGEVALSAAVLGLWRDGGRPLAGLLHGGARLRLLRPATVVLCTGTWAEPPVLEGNDVPGIFAGRALGAALAEDGAVPGERAAVMGPAPEAEALAARLAAAGMEVQPLPGAAARALGRSRLAGLVLEGGGRVDCDTLAVATPGIPASELARAAGASLALDPSSGHFRVAAGPSGEISPGLFAAGEVTGPAGAAAAAEAGRRAAKAAAGG